MKKYNKKGFTIVELVIVIAVIAILAAVLIPTFSGVVGRANQSAALQTAKSTLSNALVMSSTASLNGDTVGNTKKTVFIVENYAFKYSGNQLEEMDFPGTGSSTQLLGNKNCSASDDTYNFNSILIAKDNLVLEYDEVTTGIIALADDPNTTGVDESANNTDVSEYYVQESKGGVITYVKATGKAVYGKKYYSLSGTVTIDKNLSKYLADASNLTLNNDGVITVTEKDGHYYVGYNETSTPTWIAEVYVSIDFSKKAAVFTTFG